MKNVLLIVRPDGFEKNAQYYFRVPQNEGRNRAYRPVRFVGYDPCPATVVVDEGGGKLLRISRDDLFSYQGATHYF